MTGIERYEPSMDGKIAYEHWHRYAVCREHVSGLEVLDAACGEGYGSAFLSQVAARVVGVDISEPTVKRARTRYRRNKRLSFETGDCRALPFPDASFDVVVSMETLEHIAEQEIFVSEVKRVLRPNGLFVVSTPNRPVYTEEANHHNPFHLAELDEDEFLELLSKYFTYAEALGQRMRISSIVGPMADDAFESNDESYVGYRADRERKLGDRVRRGTAEIDFPEYMLGFCSDAPIVWPVSNRSVFVDVADDLWRKQEKVLRWASGLHEEDEALRASLSDTSRARDLLIEKQAFYEANARLLEQSVSDLRQSLESARRRLSAETTAHEEADRARALAEYDRQRETAALRGELGQAQERRRRLERRLSDYGGEIRALRKQAGRSERLRHVLREKIGLLEVERDFLRATRAYSASIQPSRHDRVETAPTAGEFAPQAQKTRRPFRRQGSSRRFDAAVARGDAARDTQAFGEAAQFYRQALEERPDAAPIWVQCGNMLKDSGDRAGAVEAYRRALALAPEVADTRMQLGHALKLHGDAQASLAAYEDAFRLDPTIEGVQREMGEIAHHVERLSLSQDQIELLESANGARDQGDWRAAAERFGRLLRQAPRLGTLWVQYGHALKETGHPRAAAQTYRIAVELRPLAADPHLQLGHALKLIGDPPGARAAYARALELEPGSQSALRELAELEADGDSKTPKDEAPDQHRLDTDDLTILKGDAFETDLSDLGAEIGEAGRLLIELASFDKGGLEKVVLDAALTFRAEKFAVLIVTPGRLGGLAAKARRAGIEVVRLASTDLQDSYRTLIRQFSPDIAMSHFSDLGYPLFAEQQIPNITFIHNIYAFLSPEQRLSFRAHDRYVTRYISVSAKAAEYAVHNLGVSAAKIDVIPNGLILEEHERLARLPQSLSREQLGVLDSDYLFINPASYNLHKGHYLIAAAMKIILRTRQDIRVLCVGNEIYPPHVRALKEHLKQNGLDEHIILPGFFAGIQDPMRISDACVLPSFIEGWSVAMNEAMFYGKPLILTDTGGAAEVIENEDIGILLPTEYSDFRTLTSEELNALAYEPRDYRLASPLAEAMMRFADNRSKWAAAGIRGREKLYARYDFRITMRRYQEVISSLAGFQPDSTMEKVIR